MDMVNTTPHHRRVAVVATGLVVGIVAAGAIGASRSAAGPGPGLRVCTWRPTADDLAVGPGLLGTVRLHDGHIEVLHRVSCSDGTFRDAWMASI